MQIDASLLIAIFGCIISVATFFIGRTTAAKNNGRETGQVLSELGYIRKGVDGLERKLEKVEEQYNKLDKRVARLEEAMRIYHKEELS